MDDFAVEPKKIHVWNSYGFALNVAESVINEGFVPIIYHDPYVFSSSIAADFVITEEIWENVQARISIEDLENAVPTTMNIVSLPECGVLVKKGSTYDQSEPYVLYLTYSNNMYTSALDVGDTVDL